jgi:hypothetical protein
MSHVECKKKRWDFFGGVRLAGGHPHIIVGANAGKKSLLCSAR